MTNFDTSTPLQESVVSPWQQSNWGQYRQLDLLSLIPMLSKSSEPIGPTSRSPKTSATTKRPPAHTTSLRLVSPVPAHPQQASGKDSITPNQPYSAKSSDSYGKLSPDTASLSNPWELSIAAYEQSLADSEWQAIKQNVRSLAQHDSAQATSDSDCLLLPTLTACKGTYRAAGQTRCEVTLKGLGLIPPGSQFSADGMALFQGFPLGWLREQSKTWKPTPQPVSPPPAPPADSRPVSWQAVPSPPPRQLSPSSESSKSTPKSKRPKGQGSGYIQLHYCEKQTKSGVKSYEQYYLTLP